jgi:hypothetical protein
VEVDVFDGNELIRPVLRPRARQRKGAMVVRLVAKHWMRL